MRLLLDTHALAWWSEDSPALSIEARQAIGHHASVSFVSAVSAYEISLKHRLGRWPTGAALLANLPLLMATQGFGALPVTIEHAERAGALSPEHRDPWDRLLAAQALVEELTIVSIDDHLDQFGVRRLW